MLTRQLRSLFHKLSGIWQRGRCVLRHASSCCRASSISRGIADVLSGFINRSPLPSSGRPTHTGRTGSVNLSSLAASSPNTTMLSAWN
jgi:hypothetical protein